jgi:hypothetical protein
MAPFSLIASSTAVPISPISTPTPNFSKAASKPILAASINFLFSSELSRSIENAVSATYPSIWIPISTFINPFATF